MAKTEKIHYILEQVRLCLLREDYARAQILLRKVSPRAFVDVDKKGTNTGEVGIEGSVIEAPEEVLWDSVLIDRIVFQRPHLQQGTPTIQQLKVCYYELSIEYNGHNNNYLEMARNYRAIYETPEVSADEALWAPVLKKICWLVVMAPADSDQVTLLQLTKEDKKLASLPLYKQLLDSFTQQEVRVHTHLHPVIYITIPGRFCGTGRLSRALQRSLQSKTCSRAPRASPGPLTCACASPSATSWSSPSTTAACRWHALPSCSTCRRSRQSPTWLTWWSPARWWPRSTALLGWFGFRGARNRSRCSTRGRATLPSCWIW